MRVILCGRNNARMHVNAPDHFYVQSDMFELNCGVCVQMMPEMSPSSGSRSLCTQTTPNACGM